MLTAIDLESASAGVARYRTERLHGCMVCRLCHLRTEACWCQIVDAALNRRRLLKVAWDLRIAGAGGGGGQAVRTPVVSAPAAAFVRGDGHAYYAAVARGYGSGSRRVHDRTFRFAVTWPMHFCSEP